MRSIVRDSLYSDRWDATAHLLLMFEQLGVKINTKEWDIHDYTCRSLGEETG